MGTEVANARSNALAAIKGLKGRLTKTRDRLPVAGGKGYLKFGKDGNWSYGADGRDANGMTVAINPLATKEGYQCWTDYPDHMRKKNELLAEKLYPFGTDKPLITEMEPIDEWEWKDCVQFQVKIVGGKDDGKELTFLTSSVGGLSMAKAYFDALEVQIDEDPEHPVALVELTNGHYNHTQWGKTYFPDFNIVDWLTMDGEPAGEEEEEAPEPEPARTRRAAQPVEIEEDDEIEEVDEIDGEQDEEEEPEAAAPVRRRRR